MLEWLRKKDKMLEIDREKIFFREIKTLLDCENIETYCL